MSQFYSLIFLICHSTPSFFDRSGENQRQWIEEQTDHQPIPLKYATRYPEYNPSHKQCGSQRSIKNFHTRCVSARYWFSLVRLRRVCDSKDGEFTQKCLPLLESQGWQARRPYGSWTVYTTPLVSYDPDTFESEAIEWTSDSHLETVQTSWQTNEPSGSRKPHDYREWPMRLVNSTPAERTHAVYISETATKTYDDQWQCGVIVFGFPKSTQTKDVDQFRQERAVPARYLLELALPIQWEEPCYNVPACYSDDGIVVREVCVGDEWGNVCEKRNPLETPPDGVSKICLTFMYTIPLVYSRQNYRCQGNLLADTNVACSTIAPCNQRQTCTPKSNVSQTSEAVGKAMMDRLKDPVYEPHPRFHTTSQQVTVETKLREYEADQSNRCGSAFYYFFVLATHMWCQPPTVGADHGFKGPECPKECQSSICHDPDPRDENCDLMPVTLLPTDSDNIQIQTVHATRMEPNKSPAGFREIYFHRSEDWQLSLQKEPTIIFQRVIDTSQTCGQLSFAFLDYNVTDLEVHGFGGNNNLNPVPVGGKGINESFGWQSFDLLGSNRDRQPSKPGAMFGIKTFTYTVGGEARCEGPIGLPFAAYISFAVAYFVEEFEPIDGIRISRENRTTIHVPPELLTSIKRFRQEHNITIANEYLAENATSVFDDKVVWVLRPPSPT